MPAPVLYLGESKLKCNHCVFKQVVDHGTCKTCPYQPTIQDRGQKPPRGIMSRKDHDGLRIREITDAMVRFIQERLPIPIDWLEEYNDLISR